MTKKIILITGVFSVGVGAILLMILAFVQYDARPVAFVPLPDRSHAAQRLPVNISIDSLSIDLPVEIAQYAKDTQQWVVPEAKASYMGASYTPRERKGTVLLYAHARENAFGPLVRIRDGTVAVVRDQTGELFRYRYDKTLDTVYAPNDTSLFRDIERGPRLVLLTCEGNMSQLRKIYVFV